MEKDKNKEKNCPTPKEIKDILKKKESIFKSGKIVTK